jgi:hypothetical protein
MKNNDYTSIAQNLINNGYAFFRMPVLTMHTEDIFASFKRLLNESPEFKELWKFYFPEQTKKPDHGLIPPKGDGFDNKWFFHFRHGFQSMLLDRLSVDEYQRYESMFEQIEVVQSLLHENVKCILEAVDAKLHTTLAQQVSVTDKSRHVVRLLQYIHSPEPSEKKYMANTHTDQSLITAQWFQSHQGLVLEGYHKKHITYTYEPGMVLCFFGKKIEPASQGLLQPVVHRVSLYF